MVNGRGGGGFYIRIEAVCTEKGKFKYNFNG